MICKKCGYKHFTKKCPDCGLKTSEHQFIADERDYKANPYTNEPCALCGKRGRRIVTDPLDKKHGNRVRCYWCYHKAKQREFQSVPRSKYSKQELNYLNAVESFYLVPLFYGEEPNYKKLEECADLYK
jgi:hypothetical protein